MYQPSRVYLALWVLLLITILSGSAIKGEAREPSDLTPQPTIRSADDPFYINQTGKVMATYEKWEKEYGKEEAIQMIVIWLNKEMPEGPKVPDGIMEGSISESENTTIRVEFEDGMVYSIATEEIFNMGSLTPNSFFYENRTIISVAIIILVILLVLLFRIFLRKRQ